MMEWSLIWGWLAAFCLLAMPLLYWVDAQTLSSSIEATSVLMSITLVSVVSGFLCYWLKHLRWLISIKTFASSKDPRVEISFGGRTLRSPHSLSIDRKTEEPGSDGEDPAPTVYYAELRLKSHDAASRDLLIAMPTRIDPERAWREGDWMAELLRNELGLPAQE